MVVVQGRGGGREEEGQKGDIRNFGGVPSKKWDAINNYCQSINIDNQINLVSQSIMIVNEASHIS